MKNLWLITTAVILLFSSCADPLLIAPNVNDHIDGQTNGARSVIPADVSATHGDKRSITLSWREVPNAVLYYVYKADSPLDAFIQCAETTSTSYKFNVSAGSTVYYRVSSFSIENIESAKSNYVIGTSLAQPIISDITDISEDKAEVTWYMENVSDSTYKNDLLYIVYCFNGSTEVDQKMLEASKIAENRAVFSNLNANTKYEYQVEAYLRINQDASEKSDKMDAATARRFRPGPPLHLIASHGTSASEIILTFTLPDMVDIALGENMYDPKPLYFTISKRVYSESHNNEYQLVCTYFGTNPDNTAGKTGGKTFSNNKYSPGEIISWTDSGTGVRRGIEYEYRIQSYVDNTSKIITSDSSRSTTTGWALSSGEVSYGTIAYNLNYDGSLYNAAKLPISFNFDPKNIPYEYTVRIIVEPIGDLDPLEPSGNFTVERKYDEYNEVKDYLIKMDDLTVKSSSSNLGRGTYSVEITVGIPFEQTPISIFKALGKKDISENTKPIVVNNFSVQDGYKDKFVLFWDNYPNIKYLIQESNDGTSWPADSVGVVINSNPSDDENAEPTASFSFEVTEQANGIIKYFRIRPARTLGSDGDKWGQWVYTSKSSETLGVPVLSVSQEPSYSNITPIWSDTQKADAYRIKYRYTADGVSAQYKDAAVKHIDELSLDANGNYKFTFKPEGFNDVTKAGNEIQILVEALNKGLQEKVGGGEISTSSKEDVRSRLVGPANLSPSATKAISTQEIEVSWNNIPGAGGYYVFRRQFNMNNTAEDGTEAIVYYVPAVTSDIKVSGKNLITDASNSKADTQTTKTAASFANSRYTLKDMFMSDNEYDGVYRNHAQAYRNQQNDMVQGMSYRYFIVPVISRGGAVDPLNVIDFTYNRDASNKHTNIASYKIDESGSGVITYSGAAAIEQEGFLIGFGQNVTATKGTFVTSGNINDGIQISWNAPPRLSAVSGFTPKYTVYRRTSGSSSWSPVISVDSNVYIDTPSRGFAYEYLVGISNAGNGSASQPQSYARFIDFCSKQRSHRNSPDMLGYMLDLVKMESVSRNQQTVGSNFAEEVKWYSTDISNSYNAGNFTWSIDGYDVFVMNRNISANWHHISNITNIPNQINQSVKVTNVQGGDTLAGGLLKVMRDYKHFFKVRSYVLKDGEKVYGPDPAWTYQYRWGTSSAAHITASAQMENEYVKWGARQITKDEFIKISTLYMARGLDRANGTSWNTGFFATRWGSASTTYGGSGRTGASSNFGVTSWDITFENYKDDYWTTAGDCMTFITINGKLWAGTDATNQYPHTYGDNGWINIIGPWDTPGLYSGRIIVGTQGNEDLKWNGNLSGSTIRSRINVEYPSGSAAEKIPYRGEDTPLPFKGQGNNRHDQDAWK